METSFFEHDPLGWYYAKGSILRPIFDEFLRKLKENGVLDGISKRAKNQPEESHCSLNASNVIIGFELVDCVFYILIFGTLVSTALCILEIIRYKYVINQ